MHQGSRVEEFKAAEKLLYTDVQAHIFASRDVEGWYDMPDGKRAGAEAELAEAVQDKRELLAMIRELEPVAALEECRDALAFAEKIAGGVEAEAKFEIELRHVQIENVKPEYADEAAELAEQCKPFLTRLGTDLEKLSVRIEAARNKAVDDPSKVEKIDELKQLRELAIVEERDTAGIDKQIVGLQEEIEANKKAAALAAEEAEILTRYAEKVAARRDAVAAIVAHVEGVACAFRSFTMADRCNKTAHELGKLAGELEELKQKVANVRGFLRTPDNRATRYSFNIPRLEGSTACINDRGEYARDPQFDRPDGVFIARVKEA